MNIAKMKIDNKAIMIVYTDHAWGNRKNGDKSKITTKADKTLLSFSKRLLDSNEFRDIKVHQAAVYSWLRRNTVPSFFIKGAYLLHVSSAEKIENFLIESRNSLSAVVERFLTVYEKQIEEIKERLEDQFNRKDYPSISYLRNAFYMEWKWISFDIPDTLPKKIFDSEKAKAEKIWGDAAEQISQCLRMSFVELIDHAKRVLEPTADGKQKRWKDASFDNVKEFIASFNNRNIVNDTELAKLVEKASKTLSSIEDPQELKRDDEMRTIVQNKFSEISKKLSSMIQVKPNRKFDLDE